MRMLSGLTGTSEARNSLCGHAARTELVRLLEEEPTETEAAVPPAANEDVVSILQFSTDQFYCTEEKGAASVEVVRFGDTSLRASCMYETEDGSAKAGMKYEAVRGQLTFEPGETSKTIRVEIIQDEAWDATLEFRVKLSEARNGLLGKYLYYCGVSIIDMDAFPTNKYKHATSSHTTLQDIPGFGLMLEYIKMNLTKRDVLIGTLKLCFMDQFTGLYNFLCLYLQLYLVDVVLGEGETEEGAEEAPVNHYSSSEARRLLHTSINAGAGFIARALEEARVEEEEEVPAEMIVPGNRKYTVFVVAFLYVAPMLILHILERWKVALKVSHMSRKVLQTNLMRKFLNYRADTRATISSGDITMAMTRDIPEVVNMGYMKILNVVRAAGKLSFTVGFILSENLMAAIPLILFPFIMGVYLVCREKITIDADEEVAETQNKMVLCVGDSIHNYRLIADFRLRPFTIKSWEEYIDMYTKKSVHLETVIVDNVFLPPWLTTMMIAAYIMVGTFQVTSLGGTVSLGAFMATITAFKEIGTELQEIYMELMEIQKSFGALRKLCYYMNLPTDLIEKMEVSEHRRNLGAHKLESLNNMRRRQANNMRKSTNSSQDACVQFAVDELRIEIAKLTFSFSTSQPVLKNLSMEFSQGHIYAFVGPSHQGKATLLELLGQVRMHTGAGHVFVPPHMRVLHISRETFVLSKSLRTNVVLSQDENMLGGRQRILDICLAVGFNAEMMKLLTEEERVSESSPDHQASSWSKELSHTAVARLNLARAFLMNPECLVMHMPFQSFSDSDATLEMELLREHVRERGIRLPAEGKRLRRPRTAFYSSAALSRCKAADAVFEVSERHGVRTIPREEVFAT